VSVKFGGFPAAIPGNALSSGDGASVESATDPMTGNRNPDYRAPEPSERMSASVGRESANSDVKIYQRAKQNASGVKPGGSAGFSVGSADKLLRTSVTGDNNPDSNAGAGGKTLGA